MTSGISEGCFLWRPCIHVKEKFDYFLSADRWYFEVIGVDDFLSREVSESRERIGDRTICYSKI